MLSSDDSGRLDDFFQLFDSNNYNIAFGEGLNFSDAWLGDLPPTFMGTATSFGLQPTHLDNLPVSSQGMPAAPLPDAFSYSQAMMSPSQHHMAHQLRRPTPQTHLDTAAQADVAAVLTALQNGHQNGPLSRNTNAVNGTSFLSATHVPMSSGGPIVRSRIKAQRRNPVELNPQIEPNNQFGNMIFGEPNSGGSGGQRLTGTPDLQWGSDPSFAKQQGFIPTSRKDTHEALEQKRIGYLQCLELSKSAATTRAPSPVGNAERITVDTRTGGEFNGHTREEHIPAASPTKRRKSKPKEETDDEDGRLSPIPQKPAAKKRKSKATVNKPIESSSTVVAAAAAAAAAAKETSVKRRRSAANAAKTQRENLSEAQKRENHIKSEQKRRGAIKEGYQELSQLVPNLGSSGYSKSMMLTMAADWLEDLIKGNEELAGLAGR